MQKQGPKVCSDANNLVREKFSVFEFFVDDRNRGLQLCLDSSKIVLLFFLLVIVICLYFLQLLWMAQLFFFGRPMPRSVSLPSVNPSKNRNLLCIMFYLLYFSKTFCHNILFWNAAPYDVRKGTNVAHKQLSLPVDPPCSWDFCEVMVQHRIGFCFRRKLLEVVVFL